MSVKHTLLLSAVFILLTVSPTYSGNIISCDSFETCPDGVTCSVLIVGLESKIAELEAEVIARTADLEGVVLTNGDLTNASLRFAILKHANLTNADLINTDLTNADLSGADLIDATLFLAILIDADLIDADLMNVIWSNTTCPDGSNSDSNPRCGF